MAMSKADKDFFKKLVNDARDEILDTIGKKLEGDLMRAFKMTSPTKKRGKASKSSKPKAKKMKDAWKCSCREATFSKNGIEHHKVWALPKGHKIKKIKVEA